MSTGFNEHFATIDLETIGKFSNAGILSFGMVVSRYDQKDITFNELVSDGLYLKLDLKEQLQRGRTKDKSVIDWWYKQSTEAKRVLNPSPEDVSLYTIFPEEFEKFFEKRNIDIKKVDFYDRKSFDISKIQYLYEVDLGYEVVPWNFMCEYEVSTAIRYLGWDRYGGIRMSDIPGAIYHNALHDAALDHIRILHCLHTTLEENNK